MKNNFCFLYLSCKDDSEADKIAKALLAKRLIACAKQLPINSSFRWQGKIENANEILLIMESREDLFEKTETEVAKLHSYEAFVLESVPVSKLSKGAQDWLEKELWKKEL